MAIAFTLGYLGLGVIYLILGGLLTLLSTSSIVVGFALLMVLTGIVSVSSGYGLLKRKGWASKGGVVTALLFLGLSIFMVITRNPIFLVVGSLAEVFGVGTFVFVRRSETKSYLGNQ
jgi:uncharacterized membrane protein (DUF2068 family)